jgi:hypothetical protein
MNQDSQLTQFNRYHENAAHTFYTLNNLLTLLLLCTIIVAVQCVHVLPASSNEAWASLLTHFGINSIVTY